jgi:hypothetical protein
MGTRSLTHFKSAGKDSPTLCTLYCQFDGYPSGVGEDIKRVLGAKKLVSGYSDPDNEVNGMGCAAAIFIAGVKTGCGNWYVQQPDAKDLWEDYTYTVFADNGAIHLLCQDSDRDIYDGPLSKFDGKTVEASEAA